MTSSAVGTNRIIHGRMATCTLNVCTARCYIKNECMRSLRHWWKKIFCSIFRNSRNMSHPFTLEYMEEGETSSYQISRDVKKRKENQEGSVKHNSQMKSKPRTKMFEDKSVTNSCEIESDGERRASLEERDQEMNNTIPNEESMSFYRMAVMTIRHRIETFSQEVSIVGLSYLVKPSSSKVGSIIRKIIWTMLLLFGAGFMVFQIYDRVSYYLTYPTMVNYQVAYNRSLRFPTVTICSECALSRKSFSYFGEYNINLALVSDKCMQPL